MFLNWTANLIQTIIILFVYSRGSRLWIWATYLHHQESQSWLWQSDSLRLPRASPKCKAYEILQHQKGWLYFNNSSVVRNLIVNGQRLSREDKTARTNINVCPISRPGWRQNTNTCCLCPAPGLLNRWWWFMMMMMICINHFYDQGRRHSVAVPVIPPPPGVMFEGGYHIQKNPINGAAVLVPPKGLLFQSTAAQQLVIMARLRSTELYELEFIEQLIYYVLCQQKLRFINLV